MKNLKNLVSKADDDILGELIGHCEDSMVKPFKKEATVVEAEPMEEAAEDSKQLMADGEADMSDEDLQKLIEMYKELKA